MKCPKCQFENRDDAKFCKACGYKLESAQKAPVSNPKPADTPPVCSSCGAVVKPGAKFCNKCGNRITAAVISETTAKSRKETSAPAAPCAEKEAAAPAVPDVKKETVAPAAPDVEKEAVVAAIPDVKKETTIAVIPDTEEEATISIIPDTEEEATVSIIPDTEEEATVSIIPDTEEEASTPSFCRYCGAAIKPEIRFCPKCGKKLGNSSQPESPETPVITKEKTADKPESPPKKKKSPFIIILCLLIVLLLAGGFFALVKTGVINLGSSDTAPEDPDSKEGDTTDTTAENAEGKESGEDESEDDLAELEGKLTPIEEKVSSAEGKLNSEDYGDAGTDLAEALEAYAALASEYTSQSAIDTISPLADSAFALYTDYVLKQVEGWESQSVTAPLYQQIDITLSGAVEFAGQLEETGLTVDTDELEQNYAEFPDRYKEKYILTFNDLRTGDEWSRTTAWQYMQDAASVGLVDKENPDDPLTLRYAYALAWITQRDISEGMNDGSVTTESAISSILSLAESMDYNPVLMRDLALYYDALGESGRSKIMQSACTDVYNYLANNENVYLNAEELFVPGRNRSNASSTISLNDFWYFNDFGEYAPSGNNGVSPEGREYIRNIYQKAINTL